MDEINDTCCQMYRTEVYLVSVFVQPDLSISQIDIPLNGYAGDT